MQEENISPTEEQKPPTETTSMEPATSEPASAASTVPEPTTPEPNPETPPQQPVISGRKSRKPLWIAVVVIVLLLVAGAAYWLGTRNKSNDAAGTTKTTQSQTAKPSTSAQVLTLNESKDYGNKYANGLLPVGDGKYSTSSASVGNIYACSGYAKNIQLESGGAGKRGPWFTNNNTEYDSNKKAHVSGSVMWSAEFSNTVSGDTRTITTNDLPSHPTGVFPIAASDAAYDYDKNPNSIKGQTLTFSLPTSPVYNATPNCMGGQSGIMLTGIVLNNGFDAGGRDAGAWEVQDSCDGHPQSEGEYHYHTLSTCIKDVGVHTVIGYALDGFPITGPKLAANNILTTSDLDACHGITGSYTVNGKTTTGYHYVMTQDFPYSVSCFRGTAIQPPGQKPLPH